MYSNKLVETNNKHLTLYTIIKKETTNLYAYVIFI